MLGGERGSGGGLHVGAAGCSTSISILVVLTMTAIIKLVGAAEEERGGEAFVAPAGG